jgi:hypothetical protein
VRLGDVYTLYSRIDHGTCAFERGRPAPLILDPVAAYDSLFGLVGGAPETASFDKQGRLLDFARQDVQAALAAFGGSTPERAKLESYLSAVEEVSNQRAQLVQNRQSLAAVRPTPPAMNPLYAHDTPADNDAISRMRAQLELATAALKGDLTNVVVVGSGTGGNFDMMYPSAMDPANRMILRRALHQGAFNNPSYIATIHDITAQQVNAIAKMAADLKSTPDPVGGGTMLDSTVIVYIGDNGEQYASTATEFPILLIGGNGIGLRTGGRTIVYPGLITGGSAHRQVSNLWNTLGHLTGAPPFQVSPTTHIDFNAFGGEGASRVATGPLAELLA